MYVHWWWYLKFCDVERWALGNKIRKENNRRLFSSAFFSSSHHFYYRDKRSILTSTSRAAQFTVIRTSETKLIKMKQRRCYSMLTSIIKFDESFRKITPLNRFITSMNYLFIITIEGNRSISYSLTLNLNNRWQMVYKTVLKQMSSQRWTQSVLKMGDYHRVFYEAFP